MHSDFIGTFVFVVLVFVIVFYSTFWRGRAILKGWAAENGFELLKEEYKWWSRGPFFWSTSKNQSVYRITVRDINGVEGSGWAKVGSWWWGLMSSNVEVRWDDDDKQKRKPKRS